MCASHKTINSGSTTLNNMYNGIINNVSLVGTYMTADQLKNLPLKNFVSDSNVHPNVLAYFKLRESSAQSSIYNSRSSSNISLTIDITDM